MLSLRDIVKIYESGDTRVTALNGVSIDFRESEFVSILGPSGCGKTTLLNVIGGLDRYTSGDLIINGRSTKEFDDADWDTYRNHSIGFVFQSYNLISHQTVLSNVELALTLSGVSREERRRRATEALTQVGLGDQLHKKPNQMSGGQMQRVAIARALVNDPDILLADEPTGALDTHTSVQIMEILKDISRRKLVVMVTHNPELAEQYSSRIIKVLDGQLINDSDPYMPPAPVRAEEEMTDPAPAKKAKKARKPSRRARKSADGKGKRSMSMLTALSLSTNNLLTKKTRTLLVSFAGSIGIIGIALILALSTGVNLFIANVQEETLTSYPISITAQTSDYAAMLSAMVTVNDAGDRNTEEGKIYVDDSISDMVQAMTTTERNNLAAFDQYIQNNRSEFDKYMTAIQYSYDMNLQIFHDTKDYGLMQVSPSSILSDFSAQYGGFDMFTSGISIFSEMMPGKNGELINDTVKEQYELLEGQWPTAADELVLVVDRNQTLTNLTLYMLGLCDPAEMTAMMMAMMAGEKYEANTEDMVFDFNDFLNMELHLVYNSDFYQKAGGSYTVGGTEYDTWHDLREDESFSADTLFAKGMTLKIVGIICPDENATSTSISGSVAYTSALTEAVLDHINESEIVKQQLETPAYDVFTGLPFEIEDADTLSDADKAAKLGTYFGNLKDGAKVDAFLAIRTEITDEEMAALLSTVFESIDPAKKKDHLIALWAMGSKNGSLAPGTPGNEIFAAMLYALDPAKPLATYRQFIVPAYEAALGLDGVTLGAGTEPYETLSAMLEKVYKTDEKIEEKLTEAVEMMLRTTHAASEKAAVEQEIKAEDAPHYLDFLASDTTARAERQLYLRQTLYAANNTAPGTTLGETLKSYVEGLSDGQLAREYYLARLSQDPTFKNDAIGMLFDSYLDGLTEAEYAALYENHMQKSDSDYEENLSLLGASRGRDALTAIHIYPIDFESKEALQDLIARYNETAAEEDQITYTDIVALMMSSVTTIINAITGVLIAFVSISLVVSSIMIGIITYISVLERTKEIGILRAIGASKRDISRVFNAETLIVGFAAGAIGIAVTLLLCIPINLIIHAVSGISNINAHLPWYAALILIGISMLLTLIAGLIPSRIASKKDPVEALRTE